MISILSIQFILIHNQLQIHSYQINMGNCGSASKKEFDKYVSAEKVPTFFLTKIKLQYFKKKKLQHETKAKDQREKLQADITKKIVDLQSKTRKLFEQQIKSRKQSHQYQQQSENSLKASVGLAKLDEQFTRFNQQRLVSLFFTYQDEMKKNIKSFFNRIQDQLKQHFIDIPVNETLTKQFLDSYQQKWRADNSKEIKKAQSVVDTILLEKKPRLNQISENYKKKISDILQKDKQLLQLLNSIPDNYIRFEGKQQIAGCCQCNLFNS